MRDFEREREGGGGVNNLTFVTWIRAFYGAA